MEKQKSKCKHEWVKVLVLNSDKEYWKCKKCGERNYNINPYKD